MKISQNFCETECGVLNISIDMGGNENFYREQKNFVYEEATCNTEKILKFQRAILLLINMFSVI